MKRHLLFVFIAALFCASCTKISDPYQSLDYAVQTVPTIETVVPERLIVAMAPYLSFGDTPPRIDTCFSSKTPTSSNLIYLDTTIRFGTSQYYKPPQNFSYPFTWQFKGQHRCVVDSILFERRYIENYLYENGVSDTVFVMGNDDSFTVYYRQDIQQVGTIQTNYPHNLLRTESVIVTGSVVKDKHDQITGITNLRMGTIVEKYLDITNNRIYTHNNDTIGKENVPGINDILIYSCHNHDTLFINTDFHPFKP